jgi:hypothetical protein
VTKFGKDLIYRTKVIMQKPVWTPVRHTQSHNKARGRRNCWPVASIFTVGPVKLNKDRPAGPVDILGPLGPATFVSSVSFNID